MDHEHLLLTLNVQMFIAEHVYHTRHLGRVLVRQQIGIKYDNLKLLETIDLPSYSTYNVPLNV